MNFKNFGIREWLVIAFISIGLLAFAFEDKSNQKSMKLKELVSVMRVI